MLDVRLVQISELSPPATMLSRRASCRAHSVARLSPLYCCDHLRFASIGQSEARFWANNVLRVRIPGDSI